MTGAKVSIGGNFSGETTAMLLSHPSGEISVGLCLKPCCIANLAWHSFATEDRNRSVLVASVERGGAASEPVTKSGASVNLAASGFINTDLNVFVCKWQVNGSVR